MKRSRHIAIRMPRERIDAAAAHYKALLGVEEVERIEEGVNLQGPDFNLWLDVSDGPTMVMQEFVTSDRAAAKAAHEAAGCRIFDEGEDGFHVEDPYGMHYHVWVEEGGK